MTSGFVNCCRKVSIAFIATPSDFYVNLQEGSDHEQLIYSHPSKAIRCKLFQVYPKNINWCEFEVQSFREMTVNKTFICHFVNFDLSGIYAVQLIATTVLDVISLNKHLLNIIESQRPGESKVKQGNPQQPEVSCQQVPATSNQAKAIAELSRFHLSLENRVPGLQQGISQEICSENLQLPLVGDSVKKDSAIRMVTKEMTTGNHPRRNPYDIKRKACQDAENSASGTASTSFSCTTIDSTREISSASSTVASSAFVSSGGATATTAASTFVLHGPSPSGGSVSFGSPNQGAQFSTLDHQPDSSD